MAGKKKAGKQKKTIYNPIKIKLLIVDDDPNFTSNLSDDIMSEFDNVEVHLATTSIIAKKFLMTGQYDIVLLDYYLEGYTTAEELIPTFVQSGADVIVMSAQAGGEEAANTVKLGAADYWAKENGFKSLASKIRYFIEYREKKAFMQYQKSSYPGFFKFFLTDNPELVNKILQILQLLEKNNTLSVLVAGEIGVGKSFFVQSIRNYLKSVNGNIRFVTISKTLSCDEIKNFIKQGKSAFRQGATVMFFINKITDIQEDINMHILELLDMIREERNEIGKLYLFAESGEQDINRTHKKLHDSLFFRFEQMITIPPLRERWEDILLLAEHFLNRGRDESIRLKFSHKAKYILLNLPWKGNILQLQNFVRSIYLQPGECEIGPEKLQLVIGHDIQDLLSMKEIEKQQIIKALIATDCKKTLAAQLLGISRPTLNKKIAQHNIKC